ncbi:MAG: hypothetical protein AAF430_11480 [Myxococcota bacterium]
MWAGVALASTATAASFEGVGDLSGGGFFSEALDVSDDGTTVVGRSASSSGDEAFRWQAGTLTGLGDLPGSPFASVAYGVSADGSIVVGEGSVSSLEVHGFRWQGGAFTDLGAAPLASALDVSADGQTAVGIRGVGPLSNLELEAARWVGTSLSGLGDLPGGTFLSAANAVSADGAIVVGESDGGGSAGNEGFRWEAGTLTALRSLAPGFQTLVARGLSGDGTVIVGDEDDPVTGLQAFRMVGSSVTLLPNLQSAQGASGDGSLVVGRSGSGTLARAARWNAADGTEAIADVLRDVYHIAAADGWTLQEAVAVSSDGQVIVGNGINPQGDPEGWIAVLTAGCSDGLDNDGDGFTDTADPGCSDASDLTENDAALPCDDFVDNDGDGAVDLFDGGCSSVFDTTETDPSRICDDGLDNDGDGGVDGLDAGCDDALDTSEQSASLLCDDAVDNDADGPIDFPADPGCGTPTDPTEERRAGEPRGAARTTESESGFAGPLFPGDAFGSALAVLGDLDGDGLRSLASGAPQPGGALPGEVWILELDALGSTDNALRVGSGLGGFSGALEADDRFGSALAWLGDLEGDGFMELAIGAPGDDDGGTDRGAVWIVSLAADGTVVGERKISDTVGGFGGTLGDAVAFGGALARIDDLDGNGVPELAVGVPGDADGGLFGVGAAWILFFDTSGNVTSEQKISATQGGFSGALENFDLFGSALTSPGDVDGDGNDDLAVGAPRDGDGGFARGAVWLLFLDVDGSVLGHQKLSDTEGDFLGILPDQGLFGSALAGAGDLDADGVPDLLVGNPEDGSGRLWSLLLGADGRVDDEVETAAGIGVPPSAVAAGDRFANALAFDPSEVPPAWNALVGAPGSDVAGPEKGAFFRIPLDAARCGNATVDFAEACDDGNTTGFDGCSASCGWQDLVKLQGVAVGGSVEVSVSGVAVMVTTSPGQTAVAVLSALAAAIGSEPTLASQGVTASVLGGVLVIEGGPVDSVTLLDAGLSEPAVPVPSSGPLLHVVLVGGLLAAAGFQARRRGAGKTR